MKLKATICDLWDNQLATLDQHDGLEVNLELDDSSTGSVTLSMYSEAAQYVAMGKRIVKVTCDGTLVLQGLMMRPAFGFKDGTIQIPLHDATIRAKKRNLRYGHRSVEMSLAADEDSPVGTEGVPIDGTGLAIVLEDAATNTGQRKSAAYPHGVPLLGLMPGSDDVPALPDDTRHRIVVNRGDKAWNAVQEFMKVSAQQTEDGTQLGFDIELQPVDEDNPGPLGSRWQPGVTLAVNTTPRLGIDRTQDGNAPDSPRGEPVVLVYGQELEELNHAPDMDQLINYSVQVADGGESKADEIQRKAGAYNVKSWMEYGLWQEWAAGGDVSNETLAQRALAIVTAYGQPPNFTEVELKRNNPAGLKFGRDLSLGDTVTTVGKKGYCSVKTDARIIKINLKQLNQDGDAQMKLELVPSARHDADVLFGWNEDEMYP